MNRRQTARRLAQSAVERGEPLAWFEELYSRADSADVSVVPWADLEPNPNLVQWLDREALEGAGRRALVVGCGLGDDAEELDRRGFAVTAFDISASAIELAMRRFPSTRVAYQADDLFHPPAAWSGGYDLVHEAYTLQVLPVELRPAAMRRLAAFVAEGGTLLVIARAREAGEPLDQMPWPVAQAELSLLGRCGLEEHSFEDYLDAEKPPVRRFRARYRRPRR